MDAVEVSLPAAFVSKLTSSSGCGGGGGGGSGGTGAEMVTSQLESATNTNCFHPPIGNNCNVNGSKPAFWNKISDIEFHTQAKEKSLIDHNTGHIENSFDVTSISLAKQSQRRYGKACRTNGNYSRRSRVAYMEASLNLTESLDANGSPKDLESYSYSGKYSNPEKTQTAKQKIISVKRSEKRNGKISKSKRDSFSIKAGLSSFSSSAVGNNIFGVHGSKYDIYEATKHLEEVSLNEMLDDSYKCPQYVKDKQKNTERLNENILQSVKDAYAVLQLRKSSQPQNMPVVDVLYQNASSCLPNSGTPGVGKSDDNKGDMIDSSSFNKVKDSYMPEFPLLAPKDILIQLSLSPSKDFNLLLFDTMKPTSMSKGNFNRGGLPSFPWSHISGGLLKTNPDVVKLTPNKGTCQGRWIKIRNSTFSSGDTTNFLADLGSLSYDQSLVPLGPSGLCTMASSTQDGHAPGVLVAAQTLFEIATLFPKQDQSVMIRWRKKPSQKAVRTTKFKSDEKLEKTLFTSSKRPFTNPFSSRLSNEPAKLRKLLPMKCRSLSNEYRSASDGRC